MPPRSMYRPRTLGRCCGLAALSCSFALPTLAVDNLLDNPGFLDVDEDLAFGDGWGAFGAAGFNAFFGSGNPHISLFGDRAANTGGAFQLGLPATAGTTYQFDLLNTRIESSWDADLNIGLEFYLADDATKIGETIVTVDTAARLALPNVDTGGAANGAVFSVQGTAPAGAAIVRPIVSFDNVNPTYPGPDAPSGQSQANTFVFDTYLAEIPAPGGNLLKNPGFEDLNGDFDPVSGNGFGDNWNAFGNAGFGDFFGGNGHASFFANVTGQSGGVFQQAAVATPGTEYTFTLTDVRVEENFDADLLFGLEFYGDDDFNKIGESVTLADTSVTGDGLTFSIDGTAPAGAAFVRPIISFDNVNPTYLGQVEQTNLFVFDAELTETVAGFIAGDYNGDGFVSQADLDLVLLNWGDGVIPPEWVAADQFDGDQVSQNELDGVLLNWGSGTPPAPSAGVVPEPTALALMGCGAVLACRRRRA